MKYVVTFILAIFAFVGSAQDYKTHKVQEGENIEDIAKSYLVTPFDIYALNPDAKTNFKLDMVLIIPDSRVKNEPIVEDAKELIGYKKHRVRRKETLFSIAKKYKVEIEEIKKVNRYLYAEPLKRGDRIRIPRFKFVKSEQTLNNTIRKYEVQPKEGKWRIAYKFGITVAELDRLNPNINDVLQPGDELNVPNIANNEEKPVDDTFNYYEVQPKEGFYRLNLKLGLTQEELEELNPGLKESGLKSGMVLKLPKTVTVATVLDTLSQTRTITSLKNLTRKKLALVMPYRLHRIDTDSIEEAKERIKNDPLLSAVLSFHEGVLMALDSAKQLGISVDLKVLDSRYQPSTMSRIIETHDFEDYNAVIGPVNTKNIDLLASHLKSNNVPLFVPITKPERIYSNVLQSLPDQKYMIQAMVNLVKKDTLKNRVVIIADRSQTEKVQTLKSAFPAARIIYSQLNKKTEKDGYFLYPTDLEDVFTDGHNIVFLETSNNALASSAISMLNSKLTEELQITLVTTDKNRAFDNNIDNYHLSNLNFHYPSANKPMDETLNNNYVSQYLRSHKVLPNRFVARGFDLTLDILLRLAAEEQVIDALKDDIQTEYLENKFRYKKDWFSGYTNQAFYILKHEDLQILKVK